MSAVGRYLFGDVAAARPYLLAKAFLLLLAFDCFIDLVPHGGRYGVGEFNVAHFRWLDAIQPTPSAALYVGVVVLIGMLALTIALAGFSRWTLAALAALYTYGWAMSQLDSYQHHYLITLALVLFPAYPLVTYALFGGAATEPAPPAKVDEPEQVAEEEKPRSKKSRKKKRRAEKRIERKAKAPRTAKRAGVAGTSSWAYHLTCVSFGIVYLFTGFAKTEPQWRSGHALRQIAPEGMEPFRALFVDDWKMFEEESFWSLMGSSVVLVQLVIFAAYVCAPLIDRPSRWPKIVCAVGAVGALSFHIGAEYLELQIGWFSYYMIVAALVVLVPGPAVSWVARGLTEPVRRVAGLLEGEAASTQVVVVLALATAAVLYLAGHAVDLPGATGAAIVLAVGVVGHVGLAFWRGLQRSEPRQRGAYRTAAASSPAGGGALEGARGWVAAAAGAALALWASMSLTDVRYDYYRFVGGDMKRRGELEASLEAYVKANRYAPDDANRHRQEDEVRVMLGMPPRWNDAEEPEEREE